MLASKLGADGHHGPVEVRHPELAQRFEIGGVGDDDMGELARQALYELGPAVDGQYFGSPAG